MPRSLFQHDESFGHRFIPGLRARIEHEGGGYLLQTNASGFRCPHVFRAEKRPGTSRILLFGDSYTAGDGVSDGKRYGDLLEDLLPDTEVYNFGLSGSGTDQQYLVWREYAGEIEHDLVIISVLVENIRRVVSQFRPFRSLEGEDFVLAKPYFSLEPDGEMRLHHVPVPRERFEDTSLADAAAVYRGGRFEWLRRVINGLGPDVKDRLQRLTRYQPLPEYDRADGADWKLLEAILRRWLGERRTPVIVCPIPLYQHVEKTAAARSYQKRFASLDAPPDVVVHDPLPDFHAHPADVRRRFRFEVDCHLTPAAHGVLAESLARTIRPMLARGAA